MSSSKPTLGYPSRSAAVIGLLGEGLNERQIGERIGIPVSSVAALRCSANRALSARPAGQLGLSVKTVHVPVTTLRGLAPAARARGVSREKLAALILEQIVQDDLVDAVLDDGEKP